MVLRGAAARGSTETVVELLKAGVDPNASTRGDLTPLHEAAGAGHRQTVEALLDAGADINERYEHLCSTDYLLNPATRDTAGSTALHMAAESGRTETIRLLLGRGIDPNERRPGLQSEVQRCIRRCNLSSLVES